MFIRMPVPLFMNISTLSPIGTIALFGWSVAFFYHLCSGIRHLAWDAGLGFDLRFVYRSGYGVLAATVLLTGLTWLYVLTR